MARTFTTTLKPQMASCLAKDIALGSLYHCVQGHAMHTIKHSALHSACPCHKGTLGTLVLQPGLKTVTAACLTVCAHAQDTYLREQRYTCMASDTPLNACIPKLTALIRDAWGAVHAPWAMDQAEELHSTWPALASAPANK